MSQKTLDVEHQGTHYPTDAQMLSALRDALKEDGLKLAGEAGFRVVENTSGGPSKVVATFDAEERKDATPAATKKVTEVK